MPFPSEVAGLLINRRTGFTQRRKGRKGKNRLPLCASLRAWRLGANSIDLTSPPPYAARRYRSIRVDFRLVTFDSRLMLKREDNHNHHRDND